MKIRALRVAECGRFGEPVAIEALSGGLDLLVGPNEAGKSTLVKALRAALFVSHRSAHRDLDKLRPYRGGAPLVEVDLEVRGERWRVRKRFLADRMAEVVSLTTGAVARGADAEARLEQLLGNAEAAGRYPLLWLGQGATLEPTVPGAEGELVLRTAISREIAATGGGDKVRRVHQRVEAMLGELVTRTRGQPRARYAEAVRAAETAHQALATARADFDRAEALLERTAGVAAAADEARNAAARADRDRRLAAADADLARAREDLSASDRARAAAAEARAANAAATDALRALERGLSEMARLEALDATEAGEQTRLRKSLDEAVSAAGSAAARATALRRDVASAEAHLEAVRTEARRSELASRHGRALAAAARRREIDDVLSRLPSDAAALREARELSARIAEAKAGIEAASAVVTVAYEAGADGRIVLSGRPLAEGERLVAEEPLDLVVPGIGRIRIEPGASADRERSKEDMARDQHRLAALLSSAGVASLAALESAHEEARREAGARAAADAELRALAPEGLDRLGSALAALPARDASARGASDAQAAAGLPEEDGEAIASTIASLRDRLASVEAERAAGDVRVAELRQREAVMQATAEDRARRRDELASELPPPELQALRRAELEAAARAMSTAYDEALRVKAATEARAPTDEAKARLEAEAIAARAAVRLAEQQEAALSAELARLQGQLEGLRQDDVAGRIANHEAELAAALRVRAGLDAQVQALQLLATELGAEEASLRESYEAPVTARLAPYLDLVLPGARIALGAGFVPERVTRGETSEDLSRLSDGTREQLAVLVRLGFARLLAEQGLAVPLLLDDALVYSDDQRIAAMHRALEAAATVHQVVVLTCREQSFAGLSGHRVSLVPWRPEHGR
ncbi:MAG: AAA family ATPase [Hyphomicrobiaceae bacterium]